MIEDRIRDSGGRLLAAEQARDVIKRKNPDSLLLQTPERLPGALPRRPQGGAPREHGI